jgi:hypothetical protein
MEWDIIEIKCHCIFEKMNMIIKFLFVEVEINR